MLNSVNVMGRITRDLEIRYTQTGTAVCSFCIACDGYAKSGEDRKTDFLDIVAWDKSAEFVTRYFGKGDSIIISGRLQTRQYTDKDGNKRKAVEIVANEINFAGGKVERNTASADETDDYDVPF